MFAGVVNGCLPIKTVDNRGDRISFSIKMHSSGLVDGTPVSIDGLAIPVTCVDATTVTFEATKKALAYTTLRHLYPGRLVNLELPDQNSGDHMISGNILGVVRLAHIKGSLFSFECPRGWMKYLLSKGFVALDGVSLIVDATHPSGVFAVEVTPDLRERTTFGSKDIFDEVNLEIDPYTEVIVNTVEQLCLDIPVWEG